jgi:hypothetical protein
MNGIFLWKKLFPGKGRIFRNWDYYEVFGCVALFALQMETDQESQGTNGDARSIKR